MGTDKYIPFQRNTTFTRCKITSIVIKHCSDAVGVALFMRRANYVSRKYIKNVAQIRRGASFNEKGRRSERYSEGDVILFKSQQFWSKITDIYRILRPLAAMALTFQKCDLRLDSIFMTYSKLWDIMDDSLDDPSESGFFSYLL